MGLDRPFVLYTKLPIIKKYILFLASFALLAIDCGKQTPETPEEPEKPVCDQFDSFNGRFLNALSMAYDQWVETDNAPNQILVDGVKYNKGMYVGAACMLVKLVYEKPEGWHLEDIGIDTLFFTPGSADNSTFFRDSISLEELLWLSDKNLNFGFENKRLPNYVTFPTKYVESDGTEHAELLTFKNGAVIYLRVINYFVNNKKLPEYVNTWGSDFLRSSPNCPIDDPVVLENMNKAIKGKTTEREKSVALFEYSRDVWEWEDYANTRGGAVKVMQDKLGNCCDLSHALIAMTRAAGIPARYMHGQCQYSEAVYGHVFVEMYVDGKWYICDPSNNSCQFGTHNWTHMVKFNGRHRDLPF